MTMFNFDKYKCDFTKYDTYRSPVEIYTTQMMVNFESDLENNILKAAQGVGIDVNKDELIKALQYDRDQYDKGYKDGSNNMRKHIISRLVNRQREYLDSYNEWRDGEDHRKALMIEEILRFVEGMDV